MKCATCTERNGSTRCEGCQQLYCLPCMIKHHNELEHQFELVANVRNELKESLDSIRLTSESGQTNPCVVEIDRWEQVMIACIRETAAKARAKVEDLMAKNINEVHRQFEQLSIDIQKRQKESHFLEKDTDAMKRQLEQLQNDIQHATKKIRVKCTLPDKGDCERWIDVNGEDTSTKSVLVSNLDIEEDEEDIFSSRTLLHPSRTSQKRMSKGKSTYRARLNDCMGLELWSEDRPPAAKPNERPQTIICPVCDYTQTVNSVRRGVRNYCENCGSSI